MHHGSILLLHMRLIIFESWTPTRKRQLVLFAVGDQRLIEELGATIGVNAPQGERKEHPCLSKRGQDGISTLIQQRETFRPARRQIRQGQRVEKAAIYMGSAMG